MKYRGYGIEKAYHPSVFNPNRETYDIMDNGNVCKANISTIETAKKVIDMMIRYAFWPDRSDTR